MQSISLLFALFILCFLPQNESYYSLNDFQKVKKTDAHFHIHTINCYALQTAKKENFKLLSINTFTGNCEETHASNRNYYAIKNRHRELFDYTTTFCLDGWDNEGWVKNTIELIDESINNGAIAVKVWKNIGMEFRDKNGNLVMIDNPRFDPIFKHLAQIGIPLVGHLGEPKNCWLPLEKMTTQNDRSYFEQNPQYHMFKHPEMPSYEDQIAARDRMLDKNPGLTFIGCHLASLEWDVDVLADFLDRYPNAAVDMAARMGQLYFQTRQSREKVRQFFIDYQDRILYGTDIIDEGAGNIEAFQNHMFNTWINDWEFFVTDNKMTSNLIEGEFRGLQLPKTVIDKIYNTNALKWYNSFE